jgi:hypothetical protein
MERVAEELAFLRPVHGALGFVDSQAQYGRDEATHRFHHAFSGTPRPHVHIAVVGVPQEPVSTLFQEAIQIVEHDVGQQRREWSALRRSLLVPHAYAVSHDSRFQITPDQTQHPPVPHPACDPRHQLVVVDAIEELLQIDVYQPAISLAHVLLRLTHRIVCTALRSKAIRRARELRIEQRGEHLKQCLLDQPVEHGRDPQLTHPAARFRDLNFAYGLRAVRSRAELLSHQGPSLGRLEPLPRRRDGTSVDTGRSLVRFDAFPCSLQILPLQHRFKQIDVAPQAFILPARWSLTRHHMRSPTRLHLARLPATTSRCCRGLRHSRSPSNST